MLSLLGLAGTTAATLASWLSPVLVGLSVVLLGRAHYVLYVLKRGNHWTSVITWSATLLVAAFWSWRWFGSS